MKEEVNLRSSGFEVETLVDVLELFNPQLFHFYTLNCVLKGFEFEDFFGNLRNVETGVFSLHAFRLPKAAG